MEIRKGRGFPQPLEKSLAKNARLFHSSHRPDDEDLSTIYYCRQRSLRTRREQVRESTAILGKGGDIAPFPRPLTLLEDARTLLRKRKLCPNNLCHLKGSPHQLGSDLGPITPKNHALSWYCMQEKTKRLSKMSFRLQIRSLRGPN